MLDDRQQLDRALRHFKKALRAPDTHTYGRAQTEWEMGWALLREVLARHPWAPRKISYAPPPRRRREEF